MLPSQLICEILGVPHADHAFFQENINLFTQPAEDPRVPTEAQVRLLAYLDGILDDKLVNPADDVMTGLAESVVAGELTREETNRVAVLVLIGGRETTVEMIALGTFTLLENPDQLETLRDTDDPVIAGAVEELLRYLTVVHTGRPRAALADITVGGHVIPADSGVLLPIAIANRDPAIFPEPDRLDIGRDARRHMAFGFGLHSCTGANLARIELQVVFGTLYRRIPTLRLGVDPASVRFKHDSTVYGVYELPVTC